MSRIATRVPFRIFVASPGDLGPEREAVRRAAAEINETLAPLCGVVVEVYGWEQEGPAAGRPQEIINRQVDECDLFVGMLWQRWGTPTGTHTSGFIEEYERAFARRKRDGGPEMWMMFKEVSAALRDDPGKQVKQVLRFRRRLIREKAFLFADVRGSDDVETRMRGWLVKHLAREAALTGERPDRSDASASRAPVASALVAVEVAPAAGGEPFAAPELLRRGLDRAARAAQASDLDGYVGELLQAPHLELLRTRLFNASLLSLFYGGELLGTHEINLLYQHREEVRLVPPEPIYLFRMLVADEGDVVPGWYWVTEEPLTPIRTRLVMALGEVARAPAERSRAVDLLTLACESLTAAEFEQALDAAAEPAATTVATALIAHAAALGEVAHDAVLHRAAWLGEGPLAREAATARLAILRRCAPTVAVGEAVRLATAAPDAVAEVVSRLGPGFGASVLEGLRAAKAPAVRRAAFRELFRSGDLAADELRAAVADGDFHIRSDALDGLVAAGEPLSADAIRAALKGTETGGLFGDHSQPKPEPIILSLFRRMEREGRATPSDYFVLLDGPLGYEARGLERFAESGARIRRDLADGFASFKRESPNPVQLGGLDEYVRSQFVEAGLRVLAVHGSPSDVPLARKHARPHALYDMMPVVRVLARFGGPEDVPALLTLAAEEYGAAAEAAVAAALTLAPGPAGAAQVLLRSEKPAVVARALLSLRSYPLADVAPVVEPLLRRDREDVRLLAVALLVEHSDAAQLRALEERYRTAETYYYNVGCWLDRILHAPEPLRTGFRRELARILRAGSPAEPSADARTLASPGGGSPALGTGQLATANAG